MPLDQLPFIDGVLVLVCYNDYWDKEYVSKPSHVAVTLFFQTIRGVFFIRHNSFIIYLNIMNLTTYHHLPKSPVSFLNSPPAALYLPSASCRSGYPIYVPARSKNCGVAGTLWNFGTGLTSLNCFDILILSISTAFLPVSTNVMLLPALSRKSKLSPWKTTFFEVFVLGSPALLNSMSCRLSGLICLTYCCESICMDPISCWSFWNCSC